MNEENENNNENNEKIDEINHAPKYKNSAYSNYHDLRVTLLMNIDGVEE